MYFLVEANRKNKILKNWVTLSSSVTRNQALGLCIHCSSVNWLVYSPPKSIVTVWDRRPYFYIFRNLFFFIIALSFIFSWSKWLLVDMVIWVRPFTHLYSLYFPKWQLKIALLLPYYLNIILFKSQFTEHFSQTFSS